MTISTTLLIKVLLASVAVILCWFFVGEAITPDDGDQLLACGVLGFALAVVILP